MWDDRYRQSGFAYGTQPNDFLAAEYAHLPAGGQILCLAEGEGRNAVFLAEQGYAVTAVDQSAVGLAKAERLARERGVTIATEIADLTAYDLGTERWDGIVSIFAHVPPDVRERLHRGVASALASGGVFLLEAYTERQLQMPGRGGPPAAQRARFMSQAALEDELTGLAFTIAREIEREVSEGRYHEGYSAVVQVVAVKSAAR